MGSNRKGGRSWITLGCVIIGLGFLFHSLLFEPSGENGPWSAFGGSLHPVVLHLPLGLIVAVFLRIVWGKLARLSFHSDLSFLWFATAFFASLSYLSGYYLAREGGFDQELVIRHLQSAGIFTALCWAGFGLSMGHAMSLPGLACLLGAGISMTLTGHYGGTMVHGDPLAKAPWKADENYLEFLPALGEEIAVYDHVVQPILQAKCYSCHDENNRKGRFRTDTVAALLAGGEQGPAIVPGRAASSLLIQSIELPLEDDEHMPPKNKPQVNEPELALLRWWIDQGASPAQSVSRETAPPVIAPFLADSYRLLPNPEAERLEAERRAEELRRNAERRERLISQLQELPSEYRDAFIFTSQDRADLEFSPISIRAQLPDEALLELADLLLECTTVDLSYTRISQETLAAIPFGSQLKHLDLSGTFIDIAQIPGLARAENLETLNLFSTPVSSTWTVELPDWPHLNQLFIGNTSLKQEDLDTLQEHFPHCEIIGTLML